MFDNGERRYENAVTVIHRCYRSIVAYLQSNEGKNTVGNNIADGLLCDVLHYKFPMFTALLADILGVIGVVCRSLQAESLDASQLDDLRECTLSKLEGLTTVNGKHTPGIPRLGDDKWQHGVCERHSTDKCQ